jgi:hypothetical protein
MHRADDTTGTMLFLHNLGDQDATADVSSSLDDIAESPTEMLADRNYGDISNLERILIPGDGAAGDQGASEQACLPGNGGYATPAACPVSTTSWRYGLRRTCRLVTGRFTSTSIHMAKPGPARVPRGHAPP